MWLLIMNISTRFRSSLKISRTGLLLAVTTNRLEVGIMLTEISMSDGCCCRSGLYLDQRSEKIQPLQTQVLQTTAAWRRGRKTPFRSSSDVTFEKSFSKQNSPLLVWNHPMRHGNLKRLSLKVMKLLPEEVGEGREERDAQPAAPLALINETDPTLSRSKLYLLLCFLFSGWWSLETKNINPIASICYKRLTGLIGPLSDTLVI